MEETERCIPSQRKADPGHFLERPYLDVCLSDEEELSDWSEEDLSLHFSASVLKSSESESEPEPGPGLGPEPGPGLVLDHAELDQTGPLSQSLDSYLDLPEHKSRPQQKEPRPHQFLRQHSLPEAGGRAYKGLIAGLQTPSAEVQRKLHKSFSLDESRTKKASCLIKNVLSKRMQGEDQQGPLRPTQSKDLQGAPRPTQSKDLQGPLRPTQSKDLQGAPRPTQSKDLQGAPIPTQSKDLQGAPRPTQSKDLQGAPRPTQSKDLQGAPIPTQSKDLQGVPRLTQSKELQGAPRPTQSKDRQGAPRPTQSKDRQGAPRPTQSKDLQGAPRPTQSKDLQGSPRPTQSKDLQGAPRPTQSKDLQGAPRPTQSKPRVQPQPATHASGLQSKPPSRGHMIKLAASLSQSQCRVETSQPITGQIQPDHSTVPQSEQTPRELQAPQPSPSAQDQSSSLGCSQPRDPPCFSSKELQAPLFSSSAQGHSSSVGCQATVDPLRPSRELQRKAAHAHAPPQRKSSSVGCTQPVVDPVQFSSRELHDAMPTAQERASSVCHTGPLPHRFSSSRKLQSRGSRSSPSAQEQTSSLGQSQSDLDPPRFSPRELHSEVRLSLGSAQEQSSSLGHHLKAVLPPWAPSRDPPASSGSSQEQKLSLGQRVAVAPPWFSSRDVARSSAQDQASTVVRVRPVAPWSSPSGELQAPVPPRSAQDEASLVGRVRPALPWLSSGPGGKTMQRKALLDPETGQFVQVFVPVPVPSPAPLLHSPAPVFAGHAPTMLGYAPLLSVTPNPTLLVQVQPTVFSQTCFMFPSIQPWIYYRST